MRPYLMLSQTALDYAEPAQRALLVEGIRPVLPLIRNTPYGKRIQNKLQREQVDGFGGGYHGHQAISNLAIRGQGLGVGTGPQLSHQGLHHGNHLEPYGSQNGVYSPHQNGPSLQSQGLVGHGSAINLGGHSIDSFVLQNHSSHSPGLTPPHTHAGFSGVSGFANVNAFPSVGVSGSLSDPYQQSAFGYM